MSTDLGSDAITGFIVAIYARVVHAAQLPAGFLYLAVIGQEIALINGLSHIGRRFAIRF